MQGFPATTGNSGVSPQPQQHPPQPPVDGGGEDGGPIGAGFTEDGDRNPGGNRWPKQETLALIKIRSEMDAAFRDSNLKGPLWDEVSRKLSELGFHRSAKKCREKFENVYKYHRRTKEGRASKFDKIYRFSDQLQALESNPRGVFPLPPVTAAKPPPVLVAMSNNATGSDQNNISPISVAAPAVMSMPPQSVMNHKRSFPFPRPNLSGSTNSATSSETSSDEEPPRKKGKWQDFFGKMMKKVMEKQEEVQAKFLETLKKRERDRVAREEAWRTQEIAKMNQEYDRLVKERSAAAAKDAAIITYLQKMTGNSADFMAAPTIPVFQQTPVDGGGGREKMLSPSPSRWPKAEISALITLRTQLDLKYQENVPKGPLWEEISAAMRTVGYNRNAKRCKEKWENINKYYKKIKESSRKRPDDSKTCPYFDQLDAVYSEKAKDTKMTPIIAQPEQQWPPATVVQQKPPLPQQQMEKDNNYLGFSVKPGPMIAPVVAYPEQQWRLQAAVQQPPQQPPSTADMEDQGSDSIDDYDDDDKEDEDGGYDIVPSKTSSMAAV